MLGHGVVFLDIDGQLWADQSATGPIGGPLGPAQIPFTFGVPFTLDYHEFGDANQGSASISFSGLDPTQPGDGALFLFVSDPSGLVNFTLAAGPVTLTPEPGTWAIVCLGSFIVGSRARKRLL